MNKIFRVIWNTKTACFTAVSEFGKVAGGGGGGSSGVATASVAAVLLASVPLDGVAGAAPPPSALPKGGNTTSYVAPNGVTVVNIATANAAGLSHNTFTQYNVQSNGLVLNNGDSSQMSRTSQLAGQLSANLNLTAPATVILNEVVAANRSTLAGFTEVLGGKADVIVANPYGITCSGCGFINTPRVTLTTGVAQLKADGSMGTLRVGGGDILITGTGLNATNQQILDLVARAVKLDGKVNAQDFGVTTGLNQWDYASRAVTGTASATGTAPVLAIDSTALGGVYANRIRLIATEAGVGVRMLGDAAASAAEFSLTSAGKLVVQSRISAQTDLNLTVGNTDAQALQLNTASLSASQDINLVTTGGAAIAGGALVATRDVAIQAGTLADAAAASDVTSNNQRYAGRNMKLAVTGAASIAGTSWGSAQALDGKFGSLALGDGTTQLYAGTTGTLATTAGDMALGGAGIKSAGDLGLDADGILSVAGGANQGIESTGGNVALSANRGFTNAGQISSDKGDVRVRVGGAVTNSGVVHAAGALDVADRNGAATESVGNSGSLLADGALQLRGAALANAAGAVIQSATGSTVQGDSLDNQGTWLLSTQGGATADGVTVGGTLANGGVLQSARDLALGATALNNAGKLLAGGNLNATIDATLNNTATVQAGAALAIRGNAAVTNAAGAKMLSNTLSVDVADVDNAGLVQAGTSAVTTSGRLLNEAGGVLSLATVSGGAATVNAASLVNAGQLQSNGTLTANVGAGGVSDGGTILSAGDLTVAAQNGATDVTVDGVLQSMNGAVAIQNAGALTVNNHGQLVGKQVTAGAQTMTVNGGALVSAADAMHLNANAVDNAGTVQSGGTFAAAIGQGGLNDSGTLLAIGDLNVTGAAPYAMTVSGILQSNGHATLSNANLRVTGSGQLLGRQVSVGGPSLAVADGGLVSAAGDMDVSVSTLGNGGTVQAAGNLAANVATALANGGNGVLHAGQALSIGGNAAIGNQVGGVIVGDTLAISGASLDNGGDVRAARSGVVSTSGQLFNRAGGLLSLTGAADGSAAVYADTLVNAGQIQSTNTLAANVGAGGLNDSGNMISAGDLTVSARNGAPLNVTIGGVMNSIGGTTAIRNAASLTVGGRGQLVGNRVTVTGQAMDVNASAVVSAASAVNVAGNVLNNAGTIQSQGSLTVGEAAALANTGTLYAQGGLAIAGNATLTNGAGGAVVGNTLAINVAGIDNAGWLQAAAGSSVNAAATLTNRAGGVMALATNGGAAATVSAATMNDAGRLQANGNLTAIVGAGGLNVGGTLLAAGDLTVGGTAGYALNVGGTLQAGGHATVNGANAVVNGGGKLLGATVTVDGPTLLVNGGATVGADLDMDLHLNALTNGGTVQAGRNLSAVMGTGGINDSGDLLAGANLTVTGAQPYALTVGGSLQGGAAVGIGGANVQVNGGATLLGNQLTMSGSTLAMADAAKVESLDSMNLTLGSLTMGGPSSVILAAANGTGSAGIAVAGAFSNPGAIHSGTDLTLSAPALANTATGGISAATNLTLRATGGNIDNAGALYAGTTLAANATGTITNLGSGAGPLGTMDSDGAIALTANAIVNSSAITAAHDVTLTAASIHNDIYGGDTRTLAAATTPVVTQPQPTDTCTNCGSGSVDKTVTTYYSATYSQSQYYNGPTATATKPTIIGGGTVTLQHFDNGTNVGGVISGGQVQLVGNGGGASFTNNPLTLTRTDYVETYEHYVHYIAQGPAKYEDDDRHNDALTHTTAVLPSIGAGIFAGTLSAAGFALANGLDKDGAQFGKATTAVGSPTGAHLSGVTSVSGAGQASAVSTGLAQTGGSLVGAGGAGFAGASGGTLGTASGGKLASSTAPVASTTAISFGGFQVTLPTNPNGYYVKSKSPDAAYVVETNPLFGAKSNSVGSSYLATQLGYNPDQIGLRLGDSNYEAYLVQQQLIAQTGRNLIDGYANQAKLMQGMMDKAVGQSKSLGLVFGQAPTDDQLSKLTQDIIWMVSTVVDGKSVLVPQVFLAASTVANLDSGSAVIAATDIDMNLTSMSNTGGTIAATNNLNVTSAGDIKNSSGTISGGDVSLASTNGSIINQTVTSGSGNALQYVTDVGKTAGIVATGNLSLNAAKDIKNVGAQMAAGGNASLVAGNNVTFDTVENKTTVSSAHVESGFMTSGASTTTTTTVNQIKSGLTVGGNLAMKAGNDITLAGTDATVGGNADLDAAGNVNLLARANSSTTHSESRVTGLGVGGGLSGTSTTTTDSISNRNVASNLTIGGNADIKAGKDVTLLGSNANIAGDGNISGTNVNVLAGLDSDETHTTTKTTTFLKVDSGSGTASASAGAGAGSNAKGGQGAKAGAAAAAGADAAASGSGGLVLASTSTTKTDTLDTKHVASNLNIGGNMTVNAKNDVNVVGSNVAAGGDATINATNVNVAAAEDVSTSHTSTSTTSIGLMGSSDNQAGAHASAGASADSGAYANKGAAGLDPSKLNAQAGAQADASASSENKLALMKTSTTTTDTLDVTHQGASITSGKNLNINASKSLTTTGSSLGAGEDLNLQAKDMSFNAAQDVHQTSTTSSTTSLGLYADASADASAKANAKFDGTTNTASAGASAEANAKVGVGVYASNTTSSSLHGSTTAQVSSLSAGGSINRKATDTITDVGTSIAAGGDLNQSATTITSKAARNTTYDSDSSTTNTAKIGVYAEASAKADASARGTAGVGGATTYANAKADATAGAGVNATYEYQQDKSSSSTSDAVVSNIKVGGKVNSTSSGKTTLEGTNITSGGDTNLSAASLDYQAAQNTATSSSKNVDGKGEVKVDLVQKSVGLSADYDGKNGDASSTTAVTGAINSGGKLNITTKGDATFTGTNLASTGTTTINSGGNVTFAAATNTSNDSSSGLTVSADVTVGKGKGGGKEGMFNASGGYDSAKSQSTDAVTGSITSGGGLNINSGGNATFVGTTIAAQGDTSVAAKGDLSFQAAHSTSSSDAFTVDASIGGSSRKGSPKESDSSKGRIGVDGSYDTFKSDVATAASIASGGNLKLSSGGNTNLEGTDIASAKQASIAAGGDINVTAAVSTSSSTDFSASLYGSTQSGKKAGAADTASPAAGVAKSAAGTAKADAADKSKNKGMLSVGVSGDQTSTATVGTISAGNGINISAGNNAGFEGTKIDGGAGDVSVNAGNNVAFKTADSSNVGGSFGLTNTVINNASVGGGTTRDAAAITSGGNIAVNAGGKASFTGTQASADGTIGVTAAHGVTTGAAIGGSAKIGLTQGGASADVQTTSLKGAGGTTIQAGPSRSFSTSVAIPASLPAGTSVAAQTADGKPLPNWLSFNAATGKFTGTPPADFTGSLGVQVSIPQENGSPKVITLNFSGMP